jgi:hypothetical protein
MAKRSYADEPISTYFKCLFASAGEMLRRPLPRIETRKEYAMNTTVNVDVIGGFPYAEPNCRGCGKPLLVENAWVTDGCPCNSPLGVNSMNETRWRLLMDLQQQQSREIEKLTAQAKSDPSRSPRFIYSSWWHIRTDAITAIRSSGDGKKLLVHFCDGGALAFTGDEAESILKELSAALPLQTTNADAE